MAQRINPTRMELLRLKKRTALATKGHKLLKDKRDGLMREFLAIIRQAKELRAQVDSLLGKAAEHFVLAQASMPAAVTDIIQAIALFSISTKVQEKNIMGVHVPQFTIDMQTKDEHYGIWETSAELDIAMSYFRQALPLLLKLATIEKAAQLMASEIEKTRRRVNALEYVLLPQLKTQSKYIRMKLDENERAAIITTMAVKKSIAG
ncbi:MAG: V-type ATP synthase subunit D [Candidatus Andersenbacteria bacterium]|nr:V-type ATP synthase subunit D [Candidatus Andersenbacteria bacterium]